MYPMLAIGLFNDFDLDWACWGTVGGIVVLRVLQFRNFREDTKLCRIQANIQSTWLGIVAFCSVIASRLFL